MIKDSKTGDFGNCDFLRKNQNLEWKTTLIGIDFIDFINFIDLKDCLIAFTTVKS